jgi:NAD+ diphosphatase
VIAAGGWVRQCPADSSEHYPRTDPAVIMLVRDEFDRALLGHQSIWPDAMFSTLAGFVEPGETAEAAVRREVLEESGIVIGSDPDDVVYLGSQPWPFPSSLMLGYHARAASSDVTVDGVELSEARWFSRDELRVACTEGSVRIPPPISIARRLIERWYGEPMPSSWTRR